MYRIEMFNLSRHEIFFLPTEHSDWTEACTEGQQYVFNRRAENAEILYFRVVDSCNFMPEREEEEETEYCDGVCFACPDAAKCDAYCSLNRGIALFVPNSETVITLTLPISHATPSILKVFS